MKTKQIAVTTFVAALAFWVGFISARAKPAEVQVVVTPSPEIIEKLKSILEGEDWGQLDDLDKMTRKDMVLQMWYNSQSSATSVLAADTGHQFSPMGMGISPLVVLDEQKEFMKVWLAEYKQLATDEFLNRKSESEEPGDPTPPR